MVTPVPRHGRGGGTLEKKGGPRLLFRPAVYIYIYIDTADQIEMPLLDIRTRNLYECILENAIHLEHTSSFTFDRYRRSWEKLSISTVMLVLGNQPSALPKCYLTLDYSTGTSTTY
jgi:hypothetical protein